MLSLTLNNRLIIISALLGILPAAAIATYISLMSLDSGTGNIEEAVTNKLVALRASKKSEIESYFETLQKQIITLSDDKMIIQAMEELGASYANYMDEASLPPMEEMKTGLMSYYAQEYMKEYRRRNIESKVEARKIIDSLSDTTIALQYSYIYRNSNPLGEKDALDRADDGSSYSIHHSAYHRHIRHFLQEFGYYDIFLADPDSGAIVYSVFKEIDFATSLKNGPYADTAIGKVFQKANASHDRNFIALSDFEPYTPSYEDPAAFIASPIFNDKNEKVGVLIFQMPIDKINKIMTYGKNWENVGLEKSGETYLVGADKTMRSLGRFIVEDKKRYIEALRAAGVSDNTVRMIDIKNTTIGLQPVHTPGVESAFQGQSGSSIFPDYRNVPVLSAYEKLNIPGLDWVILSEVDVDEAFMPVEELKSQVISASAIGLLFIAVLSAFIGWIFAKSILNPITTVAENIEKVANDFDQGQGDLSFRIDKGKNPISIRLATSINRMLSVFSEIITSVSRTANQVANSSKAMQASADQTMKSVEKQTHDTSQVAESIKNMSIKVQEITKNTNETAGAANQAHQQAIDGGKVVSENVDSINKLSNEVEQANSVINQLNEESVNIGSVLDVIRNIAEQTNLLALNAAIEAARAGEHGRGFAVVADEVRNLATRTQESTEEIQNMIERLQAGASQAVTVMDAGKQLAEASVQKSSDVGHALSEISKSIDNIRLMSTQIAAAANEQNTTTEQIYQIIENISKLAEATQHEAESTSESSGKLNQLAADLQNMISGFKGI